MLETRWLAWTLALLVVPGGAPALFAQCQYDVTVIQAPDCGLLGSPATIGTAINEHGHVVGYTQVCGDPTRHHGFLWTPEDGYRQLTPPAGTVDVYASDINDNGVIVGSLVIGGVGFRGFVYENGEWTMLPPVLADSGRSSALAINNSGTVVGDRTLGLGLVPRVAYTWSSDQGFTDLGLEYGDLSVATDINDEGVVVGAVGPFIENEAFIWRPPAEIEFLGPIPKGVSSAATAISQRHQISGTGFFDSGAQILPGRAFLFDEGGTTIIEPLPGHDSSSARDLNDLGQVLCQSSDTLVPSNFKSFVWQHGNVIDLDDLLPSGGQGHVSRPKGINNDGSMIAAGMQLGDVVTFLFTTKDRSPSDLDGDCRTTRLDMIVLFSHWGRSQSPADFNRDQVVDALDFLFLLATWG